MVMSGYLTDTIRQFNRGGGGKVSYSEISLGSIPLPNEVFFPVSSAIRPRRAASPTRATVAKNVSEDDLLLSRLTLLRKELAARDNLALSLICSEISLQEMAAFRPRSGSKLMALDGWTSLKYSKYGESFLAVLRENVTLTMFDSAIESCVAEVAKTDRAVCIACKQKIAANLKLLVKLNEQPVNGRAFDRSLHLGCGSALLKLNPSSIVQPAYLSDRQRAIVQGFFLGRMCCKCMHINALDCGGNCANCTSELD